MNTVQLECFVTVAEVLNFSKAAERLNVTQPAISHQINSLENELDVKLLIRDSKNVELSNDGMLFLPDAIKIIEIAKSSKTRLKNHPFSKMKTLDIGCHNEYEANLLPPILHQLQQEFPHLLPVIRTLPTQSMENLSENESIQVIFGYKSSPASLSGSYKELSKFDVCCIYSPQYVPDDFHQKTALTCKDLYGYILLSHPLKSPSPLLKMQAELLSSQDNTDNPNLYFHYCDSYTSIKTLIRSGFGMAVGIDIPMCREPDFSYKPITDLKRISFGLYHKSHKNNPELKRFIELLMQKFQ